MYQDILFLFGLYMSGKIDVILLQSVKGLGQKNDIVAVSVPYAKNVLFPKSLAKVADAMAKNTVVQKKEQQKKHTNQVADIRDSLHLYATAQEPLVIKRKVSPSGTLYEKVHETDVKDALTQRHITLPHDIVLEKSTWDQIGGYSVSATREKKKIALHFTIKESF